MIEARAGRQVEDALCLIRRPFVRSAALASACVLTGASSASSAFVMQRRRPLLDRVSDLRRHFIFEYYPWYRNDPWQAWTEAGHHPPADFASNYVPALGLY